MRFESSTGLGLRLLRELGAALERARRLRKGRARVVRCMVGVEEDESLAKSDGSSLCVW